MKNGLYRIEWGSICAGFVVEGGAVTRCAPVLRKRLTYWITSARWICD
jgi:hypothetical protein